LKIDGISVASTVDIFIGNKITYIPDVPLNQLRVNVIEQAFTPISLGKSHIWKNLGQVALLLFVPW
jgi:hypothetical protein